MTAPRSSRDLSLTVSSGEVVALLGANGAGKTTTLRAISGLLKRGAGTVRLAGADLAGSRRPRGPGWASPTCRPTAGCSSG